MIIEEIVPFAFESDEGYAVVGGRASDKPNFTISDSLEVRAVFCHTCRELRVPHCISDLCIFVFPLVDMKTQTGFDGKKD